MAANKVDKSLNLCTKLMQSASKVMEAVEELQRYKDEKESAGLNLTDAAFETALETSTLKHATGTNFNNVLSSGAALKTWIEANFHDDIFDAVRP